MLVTLDLSKFLAHLYWLNIQYIYLRNAGVKPTAGLLVGAHYDKRPTSSDDVSATSLELAA